MVLFCREALYGLLVFFIFLVPWMYNSYTAYGTIFGSAKYNMYIVNDLHSGSRYFYAKEFLTAYGLIGVLFLAGAIYLTKKRDIPSIFLLLWFLIVFLALSFGVSEKQIRYLVIALPSVALISSKIVVVFSTAVKRFKRQEDIIFMLAFAVAVTTFVPAFYLAYSNKDTGVIVADAGEYLRTHAPHGTRIMSQTGPPLYYYSKHEVIWFPKDEWAVMDFIHRYNVSYVAVDNYNWYPEYALNYFDHNNNFVLEYNKTRAGRFVRLYRYVHE